MQGCSFIGHKSCPSEIRNRLLDVLEQLIINEKVDKFYVGTQGGFDKLGYEVLCELEVKYKINVFVVLAYLDKKHVNVYYKSEKTIYPDELTKVPLRYAIRKRNSYMINNSEYVIVYLNNQFSNTYGNVEEAIKKKKR